MNGLDSVAWQMVIVPAHDSRGMSFNSKPLVSLADFAENVYNATQVAPAELRSAWEIVSDKGVLRLRQTGSVPIPQEILISNASGRPATAGIGMTHMPSIYRRAALSNGESTSFKVTPDVFVGLFDTLVPGRVITRYNVDVGPLPLQYPAGRTNAELTANLVGGQSVLELTYN